MPKRTDIEKILIIGSGPIVIGQACEFDYSGTQALKSLRKEGYKTILVNSNPATIMTDPEFSDVTYIEPLTAEVLEEIIKKERPDALLPTLGGQTALNLAMELYRRGIYEKYNLTLIGAKPEAIERAENRLLFRKTMQDIGIDLPKSEYVCSLSEAEEAVKKIGLPLIIRPSYTLGGMGSSLVYTYEEFYDCVRRGLDASPIHGILLEEGVIGWKEYELEVMRDNADNCVVVCPIENLDPMGVHTGDSITVAPAQTLTDKEYQKMRDWAFKCIRAIGVECGGSNIQFAVNPQTGRMVIIEMNPRVSRSSALASKATGFPIAKISALLAVGYRLDEIPNDITKKTPACFEPTIDYCVVKMPRFVFEKFEGADQTLTSSMKSVGEVMAIGRTFKEALQKAIRGLEINRYGLGADGKGQVKIVEKLLSIKEMTKEKQKYIDWLKYKLSIPNCDRIFTIKYALQFGLSVEEISNLSKIDPWFIQQIKEIVEIESKLKTEGKNTISRELLHNAKRYGFSDYQIAYITKKNENEIKNLRKRYKIYPAYKSVDTCAAEFPAYTPYFYSTYDGESDDVIKKTNKEKKVIILGSGPNRIGQGVEFDYCCVHACFALREEGYKVIMINCNPETVSTDYDVSDKLYFEPLCLENVIDIIEREKPLGVIIQFGGQTPLNLALGLKKANTRILGTSPDSIDLAEDRMKFASILKKLNIPVPKHGAAKSINEARKISEKIGYPLIIRPSYVLGGRAMKIVYDEESLNEYLLHATEVTPEHPVFIDKFLEGAIELDVDILSDNSGDVWVAGIMEHIEHAGIHSGDSACVMPPQSLSEEDINTIGEYAKKIAIYLKVKGLINLQLAKKEGMIYCLEANPRASRTVPYVSKSIGIPLAKIAAKIIIGKKLKDLIPLSIRNTKMPYVTVKEVVLPFMRFPGADAVLGPEMRSTGEVMGIDKSFALAFAKAQISAGTILPLGGKVLLSLRKNDRDKAEKVAQELINLGFEIIATSGTAEFLNSKGIPAKTVKKVSEGHPHIIDLIKNREVSIIINTPSGTKTTQSDGYHIRRNAIAYNIPIITTIEAAYIMLEAIKEMRKSKFNISPIHEYYKS